MNTPNQQPGTHHGLVPGFLPMSPQDGLDQFRVSGTMAVRPLLRELQGAREHVVLYAHADDELHLVTRIEGLEANDFRLGFPGDEESLEALLEARSLTLVGLTNAVKIQLDIPAVSLREDEGRRQLIAAIPSHGWRIQRREAFRVEPPAADGAEVAVRVVGHREARGRLHDISAGGLCFQWPAGHDLPQVGQPLLHCRIERFRASPLPCDLKVIRIAPSERGDGMLVSCRFQSLPESVGRQVQVYVMDVERRMRSARLNA